jgi:tetratricopeptide (TPR) repeat protein
MRRAVDADPLMPFNRVNLAILLTAAGRDHEAEGECRRILELDEKFYPAWNHLGRSLSGRGEVSEALRCFEKVYALAPFYQSGAAMLAGLLSRTGDERRAEELLGKIGLLGEHGVPRAQALYHLFKGETEKALDWWEKVIDQRDPGAVLLPRLPPGEALRSSPRSFAFAKRMNLPESAR